jgi:hypothetical protein
MLHRQPAYRELLLTLTVLLADRKTKRHHNQRGYETQTFVSHTLSCRCECGSIGPFIKCASKLHVA